MTTLALYSNKGGVGKTATAVNLAYLTARSGRKTLICDLDPQSSTTFYFRVKPRLKRRARGFIKWGKPLDRSIKGTDYENLDLLPADFSHRNLDITFDRLNKSKRRLEIVLSPLKEEYDLIILDAYRPPYIPWHLTTREFFQEVRDRLDQSALDLSGGQQQRVPVDHVRRIADGIDVGIIGIARGDALATPEPLPRREHVPDDRGGAGFGRVREQPGFVPMG